MASPPNPNPDPDTQQLFFPPNRDPLASTTDTSPYVNNICTYLSLNNAQLYRGYIKYFEEDRFTESTLALMVKDAHLFDDQEYVQWLHDDLVLVIILNKLGGEDDVDRPHLPIEKDDGTDECEEQKKMMVGEEVVVREEMALSEKTMPNENIMPSEKMSNEETISSEKMNPDPVEQRDGGDTLKAVREKAQQMAASAADLSDVAFNANAMFKVSGSGLKRLPRCGTCRKRKVRCAHQDVAGVGVVAGQAKGK